MGSEEGKKLRSWRERPDGREGRVVLAGESCGGRSSDRERRVRCTKLWWMNLEVGAEKREKKAGGRMKMRLEGKCSRK